MQFKNMNQANRGMNLERMLNATNTYYISTGQCSIIKVPTSWKILWKNCNGYRVPLKAFPEQKAWLDYIGCIDGVPITFDAKESKNKTSFPLSNIHEHQMNDLNMWVKQGGKGFIIVYFVEHEKMYLLTYEKLKEYWDNAKNGGRKSIPYDVFAKKDGCFEIGISHLHSCDWLPAFKKYMEVKDGRTTHETND